MARHLVLVGLPGSGKSAVGKLVAEGLGAKLIDIDGMLSRQMGMPVVQIFGMVGEAKFREMERDAVNAALGGDPCVIVPGGGWAAQPGLLQAAKQSCLTVYLKCTPATAIKRSEQGEARPLLAGVDPGQKMRALLQEREPFYLQAHHQVNAEKGPAEAVAAEVMALARQHGGWFARPV
jgi:shikimate kinase